MHIFFDIGITIFAFFVAYYSNGLFKLYPFHEVHLFPYYYIVLLLIIIIWFTSFSFFNHYSSFVKKKMNQNLWSMIKSVSLGMIFLTALIYLFDLRVINRIFLGIFYFIDIFFLSLCKVLIYTVWQKYGKKSLNIHNIIIVGSKCRAKDVISRIKSSNIDFNIIGCLELNKEMVGRHVNESVSIIDTLDNLENILLTQVVDEVIFALPLKMIKSVNEYMHLIEKIGIRVRILPEWYFHELFSEPRIATIVFNEYHGIPTMILTSTSSKHRDLLIKLLFDYIMSSIMLFCLIPLFLVITCAIKIVSKGPVFFIQVRSGLNGRKFNFYKFRTMIPDAEKRLQELKNFNEADGPVFKIKNDPRIIPFLGKILRKTSLDELPQLINVIKGEMSLVGPRPPIPEEVEKYDVWQRRRLSMKPGLTCLWQITPDRNDLSFNEWMELDLKYIDSWSLRLDFLILLKTFTAVFGGDGR